MGKAVAAFMIGLVCLFLFSFILGSTVISTWQSGPSPEVRMENRNLPAVTSPGGKESRDKKIRLAMSSFDLANGLTLKELEEISLEPKYRFSAFLSLVASLWLVAGLRKPRRQRF